MTATRAALWAIALGFALVLVYAPKARSAERDAPRHWQLWQQIPGSSWEWRCKAGEPVECSYSTRAGCEMDMLGVSYVVPSGTQLQCRRGKQ